MKKVRIIFSLTAVVLSVAGGFHTTFAKIFNAKGDLIASTVYTQTIVNDVTVCTATTTDRNCDGNGAICSALYFKADCITPARLR